MKAGELLVSAWSAWIEARWRESGETITAFAQRVGVSHVTMATWLDRPAKPQRDTVVKVAQALGADEHEALVAAGYRRAGQAMDIPVMETEPVRGGEKGVRMPSDDFHKARLQAELDAFEVEVVKRLRELRDSLGG